jgi:hypothetical protein
VKVREEKNGKDGRIIATQVPSGGRSDAYGTMETRQSTLVFHKIRGVS